jgi:cell division protein FtsB
VLIRIGIGVLGAMLLGLQVQLWVSDDGFGEVLRLANLATDQAAENQRLNERNQRLEAEVRQLRQLPVAGQPGGAIEERARTDLGLIGADESLYLFGGSVDLPAAGEST